MSGLGAEAEWHRPPMLYTGRSQRSFGAPVVLFLIVEPSGLARLWEIAKQNLCTWPLPY